MKPSYVLPAVLAALAALSFIAPLGAEESHDADAARLEHNKSLVRRVYEEGLSQGIFEVPYAPDFVGHSGARTFSHADGMAEAEGWRGAFPDLNMTVEKLVAERDLVAAHWTARGTNTGEGNGIPATGRSVEITGTTLFRLDNGRIAEEWTCANSLGLMRQLGLLTASAAAPAAAPADAKDAEGDSR